MWVEHGEVEDKPVHQIFQQFVNSGAAFGSTQWLSVLQRQCERLASLMARNISDLGGIYIYTYIHLISSCKIQSLNSQPI